MFSLVLASSSSYRKQLFDKLGLPFIQDSPEIDESPQPNESAETLVKRLALNKAKALSSKHPHSLIIGSDQVAVFRGQIIGKPHTEHNAKKQLSQFSGQSVTFLTGLCLYNSITETSQVEVERFTVHFKALSTAQIDGYIRKEQPLDCAGSFKSEGLGIALFKALEGDDPNSLVGLPLIRLVDMLNKEGICPLSNTPL
ncbi:MAF protein [Oceanospirillum multiglobuliferum]|uniref:7-methyl-GTP pyrophosphatase n=1 Tax=Oceanospirillum multiglobuliferum TaxID=64969 RepID=A0A1T4R3Q3_9GAMM|nr:nucleoside triphosphate pyrophosphatase [Oceanospirillum multiglobuliferum]OPX55263.1 septum formation inhibitor Maf [Oceanospirillum multiglobuliferum]SKA10526.1 MAF protein [Oceanospirillum multiglobuliferum]